MTCREVVMSSLISQLGIDRLTPDERVRLLNELWDYLEAEFPPQPNEELRAELDRRLEDLRTNPEDGCSLDEIERRIRVKLRKSNSDL